MILRRVVAAAALVLALGSCVDPNSPVRGHQPSLGEVQARDYNTYGSGLTWYYLRVGTSYGSYWVEVPAEHWSECHRGDLWSRALGCR